MADDKNRFKKTYSFFRQQPVFASGGGGGGGGAPEDAQYVTLATDATLTNERVLTAGSGISITDGGAGSTVTVTATGAGLAPDSAQYITLATDITLTNERVLTAGSGISITDGGAGGNLTIAATGGTGTPAGSDQQIQFNDAGSFGASANLNFDSSNNILSVTGSLGMKGNIIPDEDTTYTLGTSDKRWGHVYTGDLHLRNDRGDWTIVEERDYLCVVNNITGKKYKMMLQPIDDES